MLLGSVGFVVTLSVLVFIAPENANPSLATIRQPPERAIWCSLVAAQVALWTIMLPSLLAMLKEYREMLREHRSGAAILLTGLLLLFGAFLAGHGGLSDKLRFPVEWQEPKIKAISYIGLVPMLLSLLGIYAVSAAAEAAMLQIDDVRSHIFSFLKMRRDMRTFLTMAGLIIGTATLCTGALHRALVVLNEGFVYNRTLVLLYGAFGSGVIALVYVPARLLMNRIGHGIVSRLLVQPLPDLDSLVKWRADMDALEDVLDLKTSIWEDLKDSLSLLYPLAGSAISVLLGVGK
ncbi:MAG: hypothetical protein ABW277_05685 [Longimicrobiaceae bacterium]